jgi:hypothetical protein
VRLSLLGASAALAAELVLSACNSNTGSLANTPSSSGPQVLTAVHGHKGAFAGAATAQTGYVGILGGGPVYKHIPKNIKELKNSGFNELIVWSVEVGSTGDLNLNGEFPLTSDGEYIGNETYPDFPADLGRRSSGARSRASPSASGRPTTAIGRISKR